MDGYRLLTIDDLAARWGLSLPRVQEIVRERPDLPAVDFTALRPGRKGRGEARTGPRDLRFRPEDLARWESSLANSPAADPAPPPAPIPAPEFDHDEAVARIYASLTPRGRPGGPSGPRPPSARRPR